MNLAILQPHRPDTPPALMRRADALLAALIDAHPEHRCTLVRYGAPVETPPGSHKYLKQVIVRNHMLDHMLPDDAEAVLWVDVDLIDYPADLVRRLIATGADIAGPAVLLEGTDTFYDIGGFIDVGGTPFSPRPPYTRGAGPLVEVESVGCVYLAPAYIYRDWGLRFDHTGPVYSVEHPHVNREAHRRGLRVVADMSTVAVHAYLPRYGRPLN